MDQRGAIEQFLQTLEFKKKALGGCDEEDVFAQIKHLSELYRAELIRLENRAISAEQRCSEYESRNGEVRQLMVSAQSMKETMLERAAADSSAILSRAEEEAQSIIDHAAADSEKILEKATVDSERMVEKATIDAERMIEKSTRESEMMMSSAISDSEKMRAKAIADSREMVEKATAESTEMLERAKEEALAITDEANKTSVAILDQMKRDADEKRAEIEAGMKELIEQDRAARAGIKQRTDMAYAKAKVAGDHIQLVVSVLNELQSGYVAGETTDQK